MVKGIYLLVIALERDTDITVGALGNIPFKKGFYLYVGSAKNGLEQRISRHLREKKKKHWHIDYLLEYGEIVDVKARVGASQDECALAKRVSEFTNTVKGFGSSDCRCSGHLFYHIENLSSLRKDVKNHLDVQDHLSYL